MYKYALEITSYDQGLGGRLLHYWLLRNTFLLYSRLASDASSRLYYVKCSPEALRHIMFIFEECDVSFEVTVRKARIQS